MIILYFLNNKLFLERKFNSRLLILLLRLDKI